MKIGSARKNASDGFTFFDGINDCATDDCFALGSVAAQSKTWQSNRFLDKGGDRSGDAIFGYVANGFSVNL